jgi:DDE domain
MYLYRAIDSRGQAIDFLLSAKRDTAAANRFFRKALMQPHTVNQQTAGLSGVIPKLPHGDFIEGVPRRGGEPRAAGDGLPQAIGTVLIREPW